MGVTQNKCSLNATQSEEVMGNIGYRVVCNRNEDLKALKNYAKIR